MAPKKGDQAPKKKIPETPKRPRAHTDTHTSPNANRQRTGNAPQVDASHTSPTPRTSELPIRSPVQVRHDSTQMPPPQRPPHHPAHDSQTASTAEHTTDPGRRGRPIERTDSVPKLLRQQSISSLGGRRTDTVLPHHELDTELFYEPGKRDQAVRRALSPRLIRKLERMKGAAPSLQQQADDDLRQLNKDLGGKYQVQNSGSVTIGLFPKGPVDPNHPDGEQKPDKIMLGNSRHANGTDKYDGCSEKYLHDKAIEDRGVSKRRTKTFNKGQKENDGIHQFWPDVIATPKEPCQKRCMTSKGNGIMQKGFLAHDPDVSRAVFLSDEYHRQGDRAKKPIARNLYDFIGDSVKKLNAKEQADDDYNMRMAHEAEAEGSERPHPAPAPSHSPSGRPRVPRNLSPTSTAREVASENLARRLQAEADMEELTQGMSDLSSYNGTSSEGRQSNSPARRRPLRKLDDQGMEELMQGMSDMSSYHSTSPEGPQSSSPEGPRSTSSERRKRYDDQLAEARRGKKSQGGM